MIDIIGVDHDMAGCSELAKENVLDWVNNS